ncbi:hypothetical protein BDY21DRAFT_347104 [Lineolata rhizophorae]|uniref:Uncharacterized protein n=1 Tax=Lineolata rhizophorae TaxID=578093 RepID=A0A6A6NYT1_9PEZI|nr:hypothetical protein BDY21DRAFT_347104 [Lineolata rhizophorae]
MCYNFISSLPLLSLFAALMTFLFLHRASPRLDTLGYVPISQVASVRIHRWPLRSAVLSGFLFNFLSRSAHLSIYPSLFFRSYLTFTPFRSIKSSKQCGLPATLSTFPAMKSLDIFNASSF